MTLFKHEGMRVCTCKPAAPRVRAYLVGMLLLVGIWLGTAVSAAPSTTNWAFPDRSYRLLITVQANGYARADKVAEATVDFAQQLTALGESGSFDEDSVRLAEVTASGVVLDDAVPFQFDNGITPDAPAGTLVWLLTGATATNDSRYYQVYFDVTGTFTTPSFLDRVERKADQSWAGQSSYKIITRDANGAANTTYYYHKEGAGFASVIDSSGNDWISYQPGAGTESGGEYRGIPNLGDVFHPGYTGDANSTDQGSQSTILDDGPLKLTFQSVSQNGQFKAVWAIYPTFAQMTVTVENGNKYWMLYEGTPGGQLEYSSTPKDYMVTSDNSQINANNTYNNDLSQEWAYFADGTINRSLFVAHGPNDDIADSYRHQDNFSGNGSQADAMTVFGFGRDIDKGVELLLEAENATYTFGLVNDRDFADVSAVVNNARQDLVVTIGAITAVNQAPVTAADSAAVIAGHSVMIDLLANDSDVDNANLTVTALSDPAHGQVTNNGDGTVTYQADSDFAGADTFTYRAWDGEAASADTTVTVTVLPAEKIYIPFVIKP